MFLCPNCGEVVMLIVMGRARPDAHVDMLYPYRCCACKNYGVRQPTAFELQLMQTLESGASLVLKRETQRWHPGLIVPAVEPAVLTTLCEKAIEDIETRKVEALGCH